MTSGSVPPAGLNPAPPSTSEGLSIEDLKEQGNLAFKRAALLKRTTASTQYLSEAKSYYIQAIQRVGNAKANASNLALGCALHSNLAAVYLQEVPPQWTHAKAAADIALAFNPEHVKARFRRAQAFLEDNREGLPEDAIRKALADLLQAQQQEPANAQIANEVKRVTRRLEVLESKREIPPPRQILEQLVPASLLDRGSDCLDDHGYAWGQSDSILHVFMPAQGRRLSKASITCEITSRKLHIALQSAEGQSKLHADGCLHKSVKPDESSWQLEEGGLLLHVELAKQDVSEESEHWTRLWHDSPATNALSAKEQRELQQMASAACREDAREEKPAVNEEALRRWKAAMPGVEVQWADTSLDRKSVV